MKVYSSIKVKDLLNSFLCPIQIYLYNIVIYDDTGDTLLDNTEAWLEHDVYEVHAKVVQCHHTILKINCEDVYLE